MKKILLIATIACSILYACNKSQKAVSPNHNYATSGSDVQATNSRVIAGIEFPGRPCWLDFGVVENVAGHQVRTDEAGICSYRLLDTPTTGLNGPHTAYGEMVYNDNQFIVAVYKSSLATDTPGIEKNIFISSDNKFIISRDVFATAADTPGRGIVIPKGNYNVYEDNDNYVIVFWNKR